MRTFEARLEHRDGKNSISVVTLSKRLDAAGMDEFREIIDRIPTHVPSKVIFNLDALTFIGSAGIGLLAAFADRLRKVGGDIRLIHVPAATVSLLELVGLAEILPRCDSEAEALAELRWDVRSQEV
jgi:anti-anti-sigma factor